MSGHLDTTLEKRIAAALTSDISSADLATLIAETEAGMVDADKAAEAGREKALDPLASPDTAMAREAMQAAEFARDRLRTVLPRLQKRLRAVRETEEFASWLPQREAAKTRRDGLAAKLGELYLPFVQAIVPLLHEIEKADHEIWRVNQAAPDKAKNGGCLLQSVEEKARGQSASHLRHLQIMKHLRLPDWQGGELPVWPPHRPSNPAVIAPMLGGDPRLYTGEWWKVKQEHAQAAAERAEREEKEREAKALENYHGLRWWEAART